MKLYHISFENATLFLKSSKKIIKIKQIEGAKLLILTIASPLAAKHSVSALTKNGVISFAIIKVISNAGILDIKKGLNGYSLQLAATVCIKTHTPPKLNIAAIIGIYPILAAESCVITDISKTDFKSIGTSLFAADPENLYKKPKTSPTFVNKTEKRIISPHIISIFRPAFSADAIIIPL